MTKSELIKLIRIFSKYGFISKDSEKEEALELIDEEEDSVFHAMQLLSEFTDEKSIWISLGDCVDEDVIEYFMDNFNEAIEMSGGKIKISNLQVSPKIGTKIDGRQNIKISYIWNSKEYKISFSKFEPNQFVLKFSKWIYEALDGDFLFINEDEPYGYHIPKELINELENIGIKNYVS